MNFAVWFYLNCFLFFAPTFLFPFALSKYFSVFHLNLFNGIFKATSHIFLVFALGISIHTQVLRINTKILQVK